MITDPKVSVWGKTVVQPDLINFLPLSEEDLGNVGNTISSADYINAAAGKICYSPKPGWGNPSTNTLEKYIKNILSLNHTSVLAHASVTLYIEGVSRALTHELIRSRFLGFSQISQRYVDSSQMDWVCPPLALDDTYSKDLMQRQFDSAIETYEELVDHLILPRGSQATVITERRKRAREAARAVLPNMVETKVVVSGNCRAWRDFLAQRLEASADLEIMRLGSVILEIMHDYAPHSVSDLWEEYS